MAGRLISMKHIKLTHILYLLNMQKYANTNFPSFLSPFAVNDKHVISRSCYWEDANAPKNECLNNNTPSYIKTEFCETCSTDGCNGAAQYGPVALLVIIPAAIAKLLVL